MLVSETICKAGAELFSVDPESLRLLGGTDGAVYSCRLGSLAHVLKFISTPAEKIPGFAEKQAFICYLAENGVPVATPLPSRNGCLYEVVRGDEQAYVVILTPWVAGRPPSPRNLYDWNERLFTTWGQVNGKMHALARRYPFWDKTIQESHLIDWQEEFDFFAGWCQEPKIVKKFLPLRDVFASLPRERDGYGLIHNDLNLGNFLYNPEARDGRTLTIIDFDVCAYHWFINDIACSLYHAMVQGPRKDRSARLTFARTFLGAYMEGYARENDLDERWLLHLPTFLAYREALLYIFLSHDWPEGKRAPWQIAFLSEKRARILRGEPILPGN